MNESRLVQRLHRPHRVTDRFIDNPFAFGGGYKNGGISDEAMDVLREIFSFDYMGAAEFEWGAVPSALNMMVQRSHELEAWTFHIELKNVAPHHRDTSKEEPVGSATIYVISTSHHPDKAEIASRIRGWASQPYESDLKEPTRIAAALRPHAEPDGRTPVYTTACGWLELNNGFFFSTDRQMWERFATVLGVEAAAA